jgi:hypothetical protein
VTVDGVNWSDWRYEDDNLDTVVSVPSRSKEQALVVTLHASGGISVLGDALNGKLVASDVRRLLGDACPETPFDVRTIAALSSTGVPDAVARAGGPFARFIEFVTPEEAAVALGRIIIGAPVGGEPYSVHATFGLHGAEGDPDIVVDRHELTDSLVLDVPFAHEGPARPMWWSAQIDVIWRGGTYSFSHSSRPLFPSVYAWSCQVESDPQDRRESRTLVDRPRRFTQHAGRLGQGLHEPFRINLGAEYPDLVEAAGNGSATACLSVTIVAPSHRDAMIRFTCSGQADLSLNGRTVEEAGYDMPATDPPPFFQSTRTSEVVHLQEGANRLVVRAGGAMGWHGPTWHFGAAFVRPDGTAMADLVCHPTSQGTEKG